VTYSDGWSDVAAEPAAEGSSSILFPMSVPDGSGSSASRFVGLEDLVARVLTGAGRAPTEPSAAPGGPEERRRRNRRVAALLQRWLDEPGDYDERVGPLVQEELRNSPIRFWEPSE